MLYEHEVFADELLKFAESKYCCCPTLGPVKGYPVDGEVGVKGTSRGWRQWRRSLGRSRSLSGKSGAKIIDLLCFFAHAWWSEHTARSYCPKSFLKSGSGWFSSFHTLTTIPSPQTREIKMQLTTSLEIIHYFYWLLTASLKPLSRVGKERVEKICPTSPKEVPWKP